MKLLLTTALSALILSVPAFAETAAPPAASAPTRKDGKTDFNKPFLYDGLRRQVVPKQPPDHPQVELNAGPGPINK